MPESFSSCGVLNAPPARITSRRARTRTGAGGVAAVGLRVGPVGVRLGQVLDADGDRVAVRRLVEQHPGDQRAGAHRRAGRDSRSATSRIRSRAPLRRPVPHGDRDQPQPLGQGAAPPVVGVDGAGQPLERGQRPAAGSRARLRAAARLDHRDDLLVAEGERGVGEGGVQPAVEAVPAAVDVLVADERQRGAAARASHGLPGQHPRTALVVAGLELLEPPAHRRRPPARVAGGRGDAVPVGVVRIDGDHRVVRGAAAEGARARVQDAVLLGPVLRRPAPAGRRSS